MQYRRTAGYRFFQVGNGLFLGIVALSMVYPFWNLLAVSLSGPGPVLAGKVSLIPREFTLETYRQLITTNKMLRTMGNTAYITVLGTTISLVISIAMAYPLSRSCIIARKGILKLVVFTMLFEGGMIPTYLVVRSLGMTNTLWSLMIPVAVTPYNLIILVSFFRSIPDELEDAARIDGMNDIGILVRIFVPLSMHAVATIGLFYAVSRWNTFFTAIMYIVDMKKNPLQVILRQIIMLDEAIGDTNVDAVLDMPPETKKAASLFFSVIPILCVYPWIQRYFVKGVMIGSIKG